MKTLTTSELKSRLAEVALIDVRTPSEFAEVHIPGSRLIPLHTWNDKQTRDLADLSQECVLICQSGKRALQAAHKLAAAGCQNFAVLEGGVTAWTSAGHEVIRGRKTFSIERQVRIAAGSLVVLGVILSFTLSPWFLLLCAFVGCGLIFAGLTDWCGMGLLLARMPWNNQPTETRSDRCSVDPQT